MRFELLDIHGKRVDVSNVTSFELTSEADAACDGLRLSFIPEESIDEICIVKAYSDERLVFNGFCDSQKLTADKSGRKCFIYARSSASLLVDNEALPRQYSCPTARQLWLSNAREFGFECGLPEVYIENTYAVSKGTSCYGAINDFVLALYGTPVYATPENVLKAYALSEKVKRLDGYTIISLSHIINRSEPLSLVDYKINASDAYSYHYKSEFAEKMGIRRRRLYNLSSMPLWQREMIVEKKLSGALSDYYSVQAVIVGECELSLFDRVELNSNDGEEYEEFYVFEKTVSKNESGEKTTLVFKKNIDGELINYVA
ncbi:MAG: hypothetical protein J1E05_04910 [Eubacterium sp.]|nr:hypothetical protein [Eubacterium sp.]